MLDNCDQQTLKALEKGSVMTKNQVNPVWVCSAEVDVPVWKDLQKEIYRLRLPASLKSYTSIKDNLKFTLLNSDISSVKFNSQDLLIVLCSTTSSTDVTVNRIICDFRQSSERVLAILLNGKPNSSKYGDYENECFPRSLVAPPNDRSQKNYEPIAADIRQGINTLAVQKLCAALLSVPLREITQRAYLKKRSLQLAIIVITTVVLSYCINDGLKSKNEIEANFQDHFDKLKDNADG